jgi:hypothetical protein
MEAKKDMTPQQQNIYLAKLAQEKNDLKATKFGERLSGEVFPGEISHALRSAMNDAIMRSSPLNHKIDLMDFSKAIDTEDFGPLTFFQFGIMSNSIESVSPVELDLTKKKYVQVIAELNDHIKTYTERIKTMRNDVDMEVEQEYSMKMAAATGQPVGSFLKKADS